MCKLSKRHFWEWFKKHNHEFFTLNKKYKKQATYWLNELKAHLRAYYKFFGFELQWHNDKTAILTITVGAKPVHFKKADDLIAIAPAIPGWTFVALDQPRSMDLLLEDLIMETGIHPQEMSFSFNNFHSHKPTVTVYHPLCTSENKYLMSKLANMAVYNLLGERSFGNDIGKIEVANLSCGNPDDLEQLEALPSKIGYQSSGVLVDRNGNLVEL
jgi:hypothetical protein